MDRNTSFSRVPHREPRSLAFAAGICATSLAVAATTASAADRSWLGGPGLWHAPGNWTPFGIPGPIDHARIGNLPGVQNSTMDISAASHTVQRLSLTDGMTLRTNATRLTVIGDTAISGSNTVPVGGGVVEYRSRLLVNPAGKAVSFTTGELTVLDGGVLEVRDGALAVVRGTATTQPEAEIRGDGQVTVQRDGGPDLGLINNGRLGGGNNGGLQILLYDGALADLDGAADTGEVNLLGPHQSLEIIGAGLSDTFDGAVRLGSGSELRMSLAQPWTAGEDSLIVQSGNLLAPGVLSGAPLDFSGTMRVANNPSYLIARPSVLTIRPEAHIVVMSGGLLWLGDENTTQVVVRGGDFSVADSGHLTIFGPIELRGDPDMTGRVNLEGAVTVAANSVIDAELLNMDGLFGTTWSVPSNLIINTERIEPGGASEQTFNGVMNVGAGFSGRLTLNLADPDWSWIMAGEMNLTGDPLAAFPLTRLSGSPVVVTGDLGIAHRVRVTADMRLTATATVGFASPTARVQTTGRTTAEPGVGFTGSGTIENATGARLSLLGGVTLGDVGLINAGEMDLGDTPGIVSVPRFENTSAGNLTVAVGGFAPGSEHDLLLVSDGQATLAGNLSVRVADAGAGTFQPQIGDEFTILTAVDGVTGGFVNTPTSVAGGLEYTWSVFHDPNAVRIRLEQIAPATCDADLNQDGLVNFFDIAAFIALYNAEDPAADLAPPFGVWSFFDIAEYISIYSAGCP